MGAKRLQVNNLLQDKHGAWSSFGLGLADMHGALARSLIDLSTAQSSVDQQVREFVHARLADEVHADADEPQLSHTACRQLYGYCKRDMWHALADNLANQFKQEALAHKLPAGTLVVLQPVVRAPEAPALPSSSFFVGALCQRPFQQIFLTAWPCPGKPSVFALCRAEDALPTCATSHQVFRDLALSCSGCNAGLRQVKAKAMSYTLDNGLWSVEKLEVTATHVLHEFSLVAERTSKPSTPKPQVELPFGLKPVRKARAKRPKGNGKGRGRTQQQCRAAAGPDLDTASDSQSGSCSAATDTEFVLDGGDEAAESMALPSGSATDEARNVAALAGEYQEMLDRRAMLAAAHRQGRGTYFVREVGFAEGSVAPTSRSECYYCQDKIAKGSTRFAYFWNQKRPSRYMHDFCILRFIEENPGQRKAQATRAMNLIVQNATSPQVKSAAQHLLAQLSAGPASASTG